MKKVLKKIFKTRKNLYRFLALSGVMIIAIYIFFKVALKPYDVQITSQTSGGFIVSWRTRIPTIGKAYASSSENSFPLLGPLFHSKFSDERDQIRSLGLYKNHSVLVTGLEPETEYYVKIVSTIFSYSASEKATTASEVQEIYTPDPSWGRIIDSDENGVSDALISMTIKGKNDMSVVLSTVTSSDGTWTLDTGNIFAGSMKQLYKTKDSDEVIIKVSTNDGKLFTREDVLDLTKPAFHWELGKDLEEALTTTAQLNSLIGNVYAWEENVTYNGQTCMCDPSSCNDNGKTTCCAVLQCASNCVDIAGGATCQSDGKWDVWGVDWGCWGGQYDAACDSKWAQGAPSPPESPPAKNKEDCHTWKDLNKQVEVKVEFSNGTQNVDRIVDIYYARGAGAKYDTVEGRWRDVIEAGRTEKTIFIGLSDHAYDAEGYAIGINAKAEGAKRTSDKPKMMEVCKGEKGAGGDIVIDFAWDSPATPPPSAVCGNGVEESGEECDDGNTNNGDGCSASCNDENAPPPPPSSCNPGNCSLDTENYGQPTSCTRFESGNYGPNPTTGDHGMCMSGAQYRGEARSPEGNIINYEAEGWETFTGQCPGTQECTGEKAPCEWICRVPLKEDAPPPPPGENDLIIKEIVNRNNVEVKNVSGAWTLQGNTQIDIYLDYKFNGPETNKYIACDLIGLSGTNKHGRAGSLKVTGENYFGERTEIAALKDEVLSASINGSPKITINCEIEGTSTKTSKDYTFPIEGSTNPTISFDDRYRIRPITWYKYSVDSNWPSMPWKYDHSDPADTNMQKRVLYENLPSGSILRCAVVPEDGFSLSGNTNCSSSDGPCLYSKESVSGNGDYKFELRLKGTRMKPLDILGYAAIECRVTNSDKLITSIQEPLDIFQPSPDVKINKFKVTQPNGAGTSKVRVELKTSNATKATLYWRVKKTEQDTEETVSVPVNSDVTREKDYSPGTYNLKLIAENSSTGKTKESATVSITVNDNTPPQTCDWKPEGQMCNAQSCFEFDKHDLETNPLPASFEPGDRISVEQAVGRDL
ncbi:MAG: myxococcus cysteine-rich repeat containing protein, partial [Candidatus Dojkabacteria bacterium]|nr:myxococcus cysteine-rich repeat containing protein [Candidatus Dojkabacteria bacterium]